MNNQILQMTMPTGLLKLEIYIENIVEKGEIAPQEQFLLFSTIFCNLILDFCVKTRTRFFLPDKQLFEVTEVEITRVDCIPKVALTEFNHSWSAAENTTCRCWVDKGPYRHSPFICQKESVCVCSLLSLSLSLSLCATSM